MDYTTTALIAAVKRRGSIPTSQSLFLSSDFALILNDELQSSIVPLIMRAREEYFVTYQDVTVTSGEDEYDIPPNAIGGKLRDLTYVDSNGEQTSLPRLSLEEISDGYSAFGKPSGFYLRNNKIVLYPNPSAEATLRISYYRRPNNLVLTSAAGRITNINSVTKEVTLSSVPTTWSANSSRVDVVSQNPCFETLLEDKLITGKSGATITLDTVDGISVGDWVCLTGESVFPQIPVEAHHLLAQAAVVKCLEALNDVNGIQIAQRKYEDMEAKFLNMISPRVDGAPKKIVQRNGVFDYAKITTRRPW